KVVKKFNEKLLQQHGLDHENHEPSPDQEGLGEDLHTFYSAGGDKPSEFFEFTQDKSHQPNGTRIAFWADTREEVDRIAKIVRDAGGNNLEGPEICVDYTPGYYASFFDDPEGNNLDICCRESPIIAE